MRNTLLATILLAIGGVATSSQAAYEWEKVESKTSYDLSGQIKMLVSFGSGDVMTFEFHNQGATASTITEIAFDTGGLTGFGVLGGKISDVGTWIENSPLVKYEAIKDCIIDQSPWGFKKSAFVIATGAQPDTKGAGVENGIDADANGTEYVRLKFQTTGQAQYDNIMRTLGADFQVGVHMQREGGAGVSDAYLTVITPVPEPATVLAGALLLIPFGLSTFRALRKNNDA